MCYVRHNSETPSISLTIKENSEISVTEKSNMVTDQRVIEIFKTGKQQCIAFTTVPSAILKNFEKYCVYWNDLLINNLE